MASRLNAQERAERHVNRILDQLARLGRIRGLSAAEVRQVEAAIHVEANRAVERLLEPMAAAEVPTFEFGQQAPEVQTALAPELAAE